MKIHPVKVNLFQADRWTDMMKLIVNFRTFADIPKNLKSRSLILRFFVLLFFYIKHFTNTCGICESHSDTKADFSPSTTFFPLPVTFYSASQSDFIHPPSVYLRNYQHCSIKLHPPFSLSFSHSLTHTHIHTHTT